MNIRETKMAIVRFASVLYNPSDIVEVRLIPAPYMTDLPTFSKWCYASELDGLAGELLEANAAGYGIYAGANPRKAMGARKDVSVEIARTYFIDQDNVSVEEAEERRRKAGLPEPTILISSGHGVHDYWRLSEPVTDMARWREVQRALAKLVGGDTACRNPERVMRIPGFINNKRGTHARTL